VLYVPRDGCDGSPDTVCLPSLARVFHPAPTDHIPLLTPSLIASVLAAAARPLAATPLPKGGIPWAPGTGLAARLLRCFFACVILFLLQGPATCNVATF
jgi:hypothetical protein